MKYTIRSEAFDGGDPVRWLEDEWWLVSAVIEDDKGKRYYEGQEFAVQLVGVAPNAPMDAKIEKAIHAGICAKAAELSAPAVSVAKKQALSMLAVNVAVSADDATSITPV